MERQAYAYRNDGENRVAIDVDAFLQPAFVALLTATGRVSDFRANLVHDRLFGEDHARACREWLETKGTALVGAEDLVEREERRRARWWRVSVVPLRSSSGASRSVLGLCTDVTEAKAARLHLESAAFEDDLTGLFNRRCFDRDLAQAMAAARGGGRSFALLLGDIDKFKPINDRYGHAAGDEVLRDVALCLRDGLRRDDRLYRIGGDEFAAILVASQEEAACAVGARLKTRVGKLVAPSGLPLGISIGCVVWAAGMEGRDLIARADAAMYADKRTLVLGR